jgi:hypothetical protein
MKNLYKLLIPILAMLILSANSDKLMSQPEPPHLPDQHGYNGNQSTHEAPLDGGTELLLSLGIVYLAAKIRAARRDTNFTR